MNFSVQDIIRPYFDVQQDNDELDFMRKAAGIKAVVMSELGDDEPLE